MGAMSDHPLSLGLNLPYVERSMDGKTPRWPDLRAMALEAEAIGFDALWVSDHVGFSDPDADGGWTGAWESWTLLTALAGVTSRVRLGTYVSAAPYRNPALLAKMAETLDEVSGGRVILGLGASGPQVVEGWYGQPYPRPLARTREYIDIVRRVLARGEPLEHHGEFYDVPLQGGAGLGKPLKSTVHPRRADLPIYLAAEGPKNVALAGEIADGWLPLFFAPKEDAFYRARLAEGFAASGEAGKADRFEVVSTAFIVPGDDVERCADIVRPFLALYAGGMGARGANFHFEVFARMGYEDVAMRVQDLYLAGKKQEAAASIPLAMVEDVALVGPAEKIRDELARWKETCITTLVVTGPAKVLSSYAEAITG
jgi:F420-dependent oxidoreductase-like protein